MLECVINISEGRDAGRLQTLRLLAGTSLLDLHADPDHHRCVLTMAGPADALDAAVRAVTRWAVAELDLKGHDGVHPRLGVVDVVPWIDLDDPWSAATPESLSARRRFSEWAADELDLPCFWFGPERSLPDVRRTAWRSLRPEVGPPTPHPTAGAAAVGARGALIAYNLWLTGGSLATARSVADAIRRPGLRTLGLAVSGGAQVSCNLTDPANLGPEQAYDLVAGMVGMAGIARAELVGLLPRAVLDRIPQQRWPDLDLSPAQTIEARLGAARSSQPPVA
jgi:glutamate formiminotransferase